MKKQNGIAAKTTASKKGKTSLKRMSNYNPTSEEVAKAVAAKKPLAGDIAVIQSLELKEKKDIEQAIVLSETWYEFSVFASMMNTSKKMVSKWLDNGWLAYSILGKIRIINKADVEEMMLHFRKPAIWQSDQADL